MEAFRPLRGGGASARFDPQEAALLRSLVEQVSALLSGGEMNAAAEPGGSAASGQPAPEAPQAPDPRELDALAGFGGTGAPAGAPEDPALARLLPDAYTDDPEAAGEFRKYTEQGLRSAKQESARMVLATLPADGGRVKLSGEQAEAWLRALNDVRLTLGVRLDVTEEFEEQWAKLDPGDPRSAAFEVYAWLGSVQESLVEALM
jgi:hypothetical protein